MCNLTSHSSYLLTVDLYFKSSIKLHIFVMYISLCNDLVLWSSVISQLISLLNTSRLQNFHHVILGDFNMHMDEFYPLYCNNPHTTYQSQYQLMAYLLNHQYSELVSTNFPSLGTYFSGNHYTHVDYNWSCLIFQQFALTSVIFNKDVLFPLNHNPVIAHHTTSFLTASIKKAHAK